jgi:AcrR family transcriptional regulator
MAFVNVGKNPNHIATPMTQSKKADVRAAILEAAFRLFSERGYSETTLPQIAREAGISTANVYVYFRGKLDILFTLYGPWLGDQLDRIEARLARERDPARRIERLLLALWRDLPRASNGFANNVMQALSTSGTLGDYDPALRRLFERRVAGWLAVSLPGGKADASQAARVVLMAFDGFAMNARLPHGLRCNLAMARSVARALGGPATTTTTNNNNKARTGGLLSSGGDEGIRTLDAGFARILP